MRREEQEKKPGPEEAEALPLDQKRPSPSTSSWQSWSFWLRVLGVAVPLMAGFASPFPQTLPWPVMAFEPVVVGLVAAALLRSWWAMLIVPVEFTVGLLLNTTFYHMGGLDLPGLADDLLGGWVIFVIVNVVPLILGVAIGTPLGKKIEQRLHIAS